MGRGGKEGKLHRMGSNQEEEQQCLQKSDDERVCCNSDIHGDLFIVISDVIVLSEWFGDIKCNLVLKMVSLLLVEF